MTCVKGTDGVLTYACDCCGRPEPPMYDLVDELWLSRALANELLCIDCFQARLGRKVVWDDLKPDAMLTKDMELGLRIRGQS